MLIKNGKIFTMLEDTPLERADLRIKGKKIAEIGKDLKPEKDEEVINAQGHWVLPGFIDGHTHLGIHESGLGFEGNDTNERSDPFTPQLRAIDGCNPNDVDFRDAVQAGVTMAMVGPGSGNTVGGGFMTIRTWGQDIDEMVIDPYSAMKCAFGENVRRLYGTQGKLPVTRMGTASILRKALTDARNYQARKAAAAEKGEVFDINLQYEPLLPVLERKIPLKAHAHRADDILTAMRIAREFNVRMTLDHCTEGDLILEEIKAAKLEAFVGPTLLTATKVETRNKSFDTLVKLNAAGIKVAVTTDHPVIPLSLLPICAGYAYKAGMPLIEALRAITRYPAEIIGQGDQYGSLAKGMFANITIYDDNPLSNLSHCLMTIGEGEVIYKA
jgi:imidazolonepropionase-like amidohydrolase